MSALQMYSEVGLAALADRYHVVQQASTFDDPDVFRAPRLSSSNSRYMEKSGASYVISWESVSDKILPVAMSGRHDFLTESKLFTFSRGQGLVGRMFKEHSGEDTHEILSNMMFVNPCEFLRKQHALLTGIGSILFVLRGRTLYEFGFEVALGASGASSFVLSEMTIRDAKPCRQLSLRGAPGSSSSSTSGSEASDRDPTKGSRTRSPSPVHIKPEWLCTIISEGSRTRSPSPLHIKPEWFPSIGSQGHPFCCKAPCRFESSSKRGCKDGANCTRCHLCFFSRERARDKKEVKLI